MADVEWLKRQMGDLLEEALKDWRGKCSPHCHISVSRPSPTVLQVGHRTDRGMEYLEITIKRKYS